MLHISLRFRHCANIPSIVAPDKIPVGEVAAEIQVVGEVSAGRTAPIVAECPCIERLTVETAAIARSRQKNRVPIRFVGKFSAGYTITVTVRFHKGFAFPVKHTFIQFHDNSTQV